MEVCRGWLESRCREEAVPMDATEQEAVPNENEEKGMDSIPYTYIQIEHLHGVVLKLRQTVCKFVTRI